MSKYLETKIEFLKGVGPAKAKLLNEELGIFTIHDLLLHFPFRYEDRSTFHRISQLRFAEGNVQIKGIITNVSVIGATKKQRLTAILNDQTGEIELVWFKGVNWMKSKIKTGVAYLVYGKTSEFNGKYNISHPEIEPITTQNQNGTNQLLPVYSVTEKLKRKYLDSKAIARLTLEVVRKQDFHIEESIDSWLLQKLGLITYQAAIISIHLPNDQAKLNSSLQRLKFEELFFIQLRMFKEKKIREQKYQGIQFAKTHLVNKFYEEILPFNLTEAQKEVIKEIYADLHSGYQMNRLLQGDVGSGKTVTAFICALIAISSGYQAAIMAPTEILAIQHAQGLETFCKKLNITIGLITGSTGKAKRRDLLQKLITGELHILVGTHALIENDVQFENLGFVVIDEQHRFGVAQRARLWQKNKNAFPHVLVMTATPIPRTLAMTLYGDLEVSTINELPKGRKPIQTTHLNDNNRLKLFGFIQKQIDEGRQIYIVYPLIEESETLELKDLMDGYESISRSFPKVPLSIVHGKMKPKDKDYEMNRFVSGQTKIMVATTVIEVGVNVPNASVMVIENAERFGLSQLHQLRGRVGRGSDQSYCILMTGSKLSKEARERIKCMVDTTDGFKIAEKDLEIRGPGDLMGTQQSGLLDLKVADITTDQELLKTAREEARKIISEDPELSLPKHANILKSINQKKKSLLSWSSIS
ncbi:ATP-dependent DNA helicase RecG [Reichenbachiella versicolor]|uniref:ATP-dependent DNA helicase RecG n=1 Tax=Reichenbachiella versicolor TaxID=1821036 RepID=UPI000D6E3F16|nr:ATP-dependent DNA helicase RecG [Reichenbachiella versicolor]